MYEDKFERVCKDQSSIHWSTLFGSNVKIGENVVIDKNCRIGDNVFIGHNTVIREGVTIYPNTIIGHLVMIEADTTIGSNVTIQSQCHITKEALIEDRVFFGPMAMCINTWRIKHGRKDIPLIIEGPIIRWGARIGSGSKIMPGIEIGEQAMLAVGAVATASIPPFSVWMGVPAKQHRTSFADEAFDNELKKEAYLCNGINKQWGEE